MVETKDDASLAVQQTAAATPSAPSSAVTSSAEKCVDVNALVQKEHNPPAPYDTDQPLQRSTVHDDTDIDIIWHNLHADSDFTAFRKKSDGPMERILVDFARVVEAGVFEEVVSVTASKYMFNVTVVCSKGWDEVSGFIGAIL
ncbi:uncharacterized protein BHQ10_002254 [Talaromyces amestolkiae]|uniref:Uncharacterized protein n=1 Tax=Talaromyces amestolkiae TaxID=1196081 RepID=A0A364KRQ7_TALAM|nr:uncharacterized protein BHQ10_002254 [Talaromyces amestolkiae]RAO66242.1 hypothetical protein BHQ10_002254 [Talaromyces amestolkiae]